MLRLQLLDVFGSKSVSWELVQGFGTFESRHNYDFCLERYRKDMENIGATAGNTLATKQCVSMCELLFPFVSEARAISCYTRYKI